MPGRNSADNKFGLSPYIVGPVLGDGVNYTSIQSAINDAAAAGGGTVFIRSNSAPYIENIALAPGVDLVGVESQSIGVSSGGGLYARVVVQTNMTAPAGGDCLLQNLYLDGNGSFTLNLNGGGSTVFVEDCSFSNGVTYPIHVESSDIKMNRCNINAGGSTAVYYDIGGGTVRMFDSRVDANNYCFEMQVGGSLFCDTCILVSGAAGVLFDNAGGNIEFSRSQLIANASPAIDMQVGGTCVLNYNNITSATQAINFNAVGPVVRSYQNSYVIGAGSEYVVGPGQYEYGSDVVNPVFAQGIDVATTQVKYAWRPWAEAVAAPGLFSTKGACSFDSSQFSSTDGFIQLTGSVPLTVNADAGSATPTANTLQILTGSHISTTGAGNTVTINVGGSVPTDWQMDGATTAQSVGGLMLLLGGSGIRTSGNGSNTITINGITYTDTAVNVTAQDDEGYFATGGGSVTITTQAGAAQGASLGVVRVGTTTTIVDAQPGQFLRIGSSISSSGGTATATADGDAITFVFRSSNTTWYATQVVGNWTLA